MNLTVTLSPPAPLEQFARSRDEYLDQLDYSQELWLEVLVPGAECRWIRSRTEEAIGHVVVHQGTVLIEFHLRRSFWVFNETVLAQVIKQLSLEQAWVKCFDSLLLSGALALQREIETMGLLVRDYVPRRLPVDRKPAYRRRVGVVGDLERIVQVDQEVFTVPERLRSVLANGWIRIFERDNILLGFGVLRPVVPGRPDVDVGIAVDRPYRGRAYATFMYAELLEECMEKGWNPVCGCSSDNRASRHLGERVGMVPRHRLLALRF